MERETFAAIVPSASDSKNAGEEESKQVTALEESTAENAAGAGAGVDSLETNSMVKELAK